MNLMCTDHDKKNWREQTRSQLHLPPLSIGQTSKPSRRKPSWHSLSRDVLVGGRLKGTRSLRSPSVALKAALH
jgi:hypothetical protein